MDDGHEHKIEYLLHQVDEDNLPRLTHVSQPAPGGLVLVIVIILALVYTLLR